MKRKWREKQIKLEASRKKKNSIRAFFEVPKISIFKAAHFATLTSKQNKIAKNRIKLKKKAKKEKEKKKTLRKGKVDIFSRISNNKENC